ncbi:hypothetical protein DL763_001251 [Monosporascus cannonballus]|nr:hypothetical protein DL763_001251 [Monosporascus cannonballus]
MPAAGREMSSRRGGKPKLTPEQIKRAENLLRQYFDSDWLRRLTFEGMIAYGSFGVTWKAKFEPRRGVGGKRTVDYSDDVLEDERAKRRRLSQSLPRDRSGGQRPGIDGEQHLLRGPVGVVSAYARLDENVVAPFKTASESPSEYEDED